MMSEGKKLQKMLAEHLRQKDRAELALLRSKIKLARLNRQTMLREARGSCRAARAALVEQQRGERTSLFERHRGERIAERATCSAGKESAKTKGTEAEAEAKREVRLERAMQRRGRSDAKARVRSTAKERRQEDDYAVRNNLPPELRAVFDKVGKKIKGTEKKTRTEAFLDWAEENPEELLAVQQAEADRELKQLLKQQREQGRTVRNAKRYKLPPEELEKLLAEVPF